MAQSYGWRHNSPKNAAAQSVNQIEWGNPGADQMMENPLSQRPYPWGEDLSPDQANYEGSEIGTTSAVRAFCRGAGPYGNEELSGNVWEWLLSEPGDLASGAYYNGESESGVPMILEPVIDDDDELLPKEQWLQDYCRHEVDSDRKVLVYLRQTGRRDIRGRLQSILVSAGLRAEVLPDSVSPKKREAWIEERIDEMDILIVNPERTATGLDLIQFATAIYYEISYSLYMLSQSSRRVWRLGQQKPVKIVYAVYEDSMESAALSLMGQKMAAAALLYGDDASSAITEESSGGGDFLSELANRLLKGEQLTSDGISGLLEQSEPEGSQSVWGMLRWKMTMR